MLPINRFIQSSDASTELIGRPERAKQGLVAKRGWMLRRGLGGFLYEGHVPHTGRARIQEVASLSKAMGMLEWLETHQPLKS